MSTCAWRAASVCGVMCTLTVILVPLLTLLIVAGPRYPTGLQAGGLPWVGGWGLMAVVCLFRVATTAPGPIPPFHRDDAVDAALEEAIRREGGDVSNVETENYLGTTVCEKCHVYKFRGTHHCSSCGTCVAEMDHHCPWIGQCVGRGNGKFFLLFLAYVGGLCISGAVVAVVDLAVSSRAILSLEDGVGNECARNATNGERCAPAGLTSDAAALVDIGVVVVGAVFACVLIPFAVQMMNHYTTGVSTLDAMRRQRGGGHPTRAPSVAPLVAEGGAGITSVDVGDSSEMPEWKRNARRFFGVGSMWAWPLPTDPVWDWATEEERFYEEVIRPTARAVVAGRHAKGDATTN